jgi:hypothetical protein
VFLENRLFLAGSGEVWYIIQEAGGALGRGIDGRFFAGDSPGQGQLSAPGGSAAPSRKYQNLARNPLKNLDCVARLKT